jgi:dephospho-CoA kinase
MKKTLKKIRVAITGNIGSGKSTFSKFLSESGYPVIFADNISKEILASDPDIRKEVIKDLGVQAFNGNKVNKIFIAEKIFSNTTSLRKINSILHPRVRKKIELLSKEYFNTHNIVFVETALVFESRIEDLYDYIVLVTADKDLRMNRILSEKRLSKKDFNQRDKNQIKEEIKMKKADFVFSNDGSLNELKHKAFLLLHLLQPTLK